jgi:hypothetical protein
VFASVLTTNQKGAIAETAIAHAAIKLGIEVYRPVAEGGRFDLIFAFPDASPARVQCKWAPLVNGTVAIRSYSARRAREGVLHLRLEPARNNQVDRVNYAPGYELGAIAQLGERVAGSHEVGGSSPPGSTSLEAA